MNKRNLTLSLFGILFAALSVNAAQESPNIVVILADDLGYGDLGCYGSQVIATPRLDRMAEEGVRFTDFYVAAPFCSPSRAALLTGRLPARCGVPYVLFPSEHTGLPPKEITLAELLKPAGYTTACVGKWHLGWRRELRPMQQGFDEYFGLLHTNDAEPWLVGDPFRQLSMFEPLTLRDGDRVVEAPVDQSMLTQKYTQRALDFGPLLKGQSFRDDPRTLFHYFGVQLQAVREGPWKLLVPVEDYPKQRVPSRWFEHQPRVFERQHRLWPKTTRYDLSNDVGERTDVADEHPEVVGRILGDARKFDPTFQENIAPVLYLPGPRPPAAGQIRMPDEDVEEWLSLIK